MLRMMGTEQRSASRLTYGRVDEHGDEHVETEFACLVRRIPVLPVRSWWIGHDEHGRRIGFPIRRQPRSVLAAYLRLWAPVAALAILAFVGSPAAVAIAAVLFALSAWSWTWWSRDAGERRRSDFDLLAFGTRCAPARMTDEMLAQLRQQLAQRASDDGEVRSPDDVIRFGANSLEEAIITYGRLRLELPRGRAGAGRDPAALADQVIASAFKRFPRRGGPYRELRLGPSDALGAAISAAAADRARASRAAIPDIHRPAPAMGLPVPRPLRNLWLQLGLLALTSVAAGLAIRAYDHSVGAHRPDAGELDQLEYSVLSDEIAGRTVRRARDRVRVACDYVQHVAGTDLTRCGVGSRVLEVAGGSADTDSGDVVEGRIEPRRVNKRCGLAVADIDPPAYYNFYLHRESPSAPFLFRALALGLALAALAAWFVWLHVQGLRRLPRPFVIRS